MSFVKAKKSLGQHFLKDRNIARKITESLLPVTGDVLEIGPGTGVLTRYLLEDPRISVRAIDIDRESIAYLHAELPDAKDRILYGDFLKMNIPDFYTAPFSVIGNLPYNISSQIFFRVLEYRQLIPQVVCMIQKEVAERISAPYGNKAYGILSVFLQAYYDIEYLFTVNESVFDPPPKVKSAVIRLIRNNRQELGCDEKLFFSLVKTGFNQRRKTLRNSIRTLCPDGFASEYLNMRPEQLSVDDFIRLCGEISRARQNTPDTLFVNP